MVTRSLAIALTLCVQLYATAIALIVTPRFVVIAADSKAVDAHGAANGEVCKIRRAGEVFYIPNKFVSHRASGYDWNHTILGSRGDSVAELASKVKSTIAGPLNRAIVQSRAEDPMAFKDNFASAQAMGVVFVGFEKGAPAVVDLTFIIEDLNAADLKLRVEQHICPGADCSQGYVGIFVPQELKTTFEREHPRYWMGDASTVAANAEAFINLAIRQRLPDVGPPISVLVLDSPKGQWLKSGVCRP